MGRSHDIDIQSFLGPGKCGPTVLQRIREHRFSDWQKTPVFRVHIKSGPARGDRGGEGPDTHELGAAGDINHGRKAGGHGIFAGGADARARFCDIRSGRQRAKLDLEFQPCPTQGVINPTSLPRCARGMQQRDMGGLEGECGQHVGHRLLADELNEGGGHAEKN